MESTEIEHATNEAFRVKSANDHDVLIRLEVKMEGIKCDIKELKEGVTKRIDNLESKSAEHESRHKKIDEDIVTIKTWGAAGLLLLGIAQFLISKFL